MSPEEIKKMYQFEKNYWWHVGRRYIIEALIVKSLMRGGRKENFKILDIGCGTGINLKILERFGQVVGLDKSRVALNFCRERGFSDLILGAVENTPLPDNQFDLVTSFDVLEHIPDDNKAIKEIYRITKYGGRAFFIVPAFKFLWSGHDEALAHQRRYSFKELEKKVKEAGFKIEKMCYAIFFFFLPIVVYRLFERILKNKNSRSSYVKLPNWLNIFFIFLLKIEAYLLKRISLPIGVSIICLARK